MVFQLKPIWEGWNESSIKFDAIVADDGAFRALEFAPGPLCSILAFQLPYG